MSLFSSIVKVAAPIVGGVLGGPVGAAAGTAVSGLLAANEQEKAAKKQQDLLNRQQAVSRADQLPFLQAGQGAVNRLSELAGVSGNTAAPGYGSLSQPFEFNNFTADPGYQFRLDQGLKALDRQAAARGGLISGNALKAATSFGQEAGSQEYDKAYNRELNRFQINRAHLLNPLQSLAGVGQTSANVVGGQAQGYAGGVNEAIAGGTNARTAGLVGGANIVNQGVQQQQNNDMFQQLLGLWNKPSGVQSLNSSWMSDSPYG